MYRAVPFVIYFVSVPVLVFLLFFLLNLLFSRNKIAVRRRNYVSLNLCFKMKNKVLLEVLLVTLYEWNVSGLSVVAYISQSASYTLCQHTSHILSAFFTARISRVPVGLQ